MVPVVCMQSRLLANVITKLLRTCLVGSSLNFTPLPGSHTSRNLPNVALSSRGNPHQTRPSLRLPHPALIHLLRLTGLALHADPFQADTKERSNLLRALWEFGPLEQIENLAPLGISDHYIS